MTSLSQISLARQIAEQMSNSDVDCRVDDWDNYGGFALIAEIKNLGRDNKPTVRSFSLRPTVNFLKRVMWNHKGLATLNYIECPKREYTKSFGQSYFEGYEKSYIYIDITVPEG